MSEAPVIGFKSPNDDSESSHLLTQRLMRIVRWMDFIRHATSG